MKRYHVCSASVAINPQSAVFARSALYVRAHSLNWMCVCVCVRVFGKNVIFVLADKRGGHMLESKHDLKLENRRILQGPEKRGPKFCISG